MSEPTKRGPGRPPLGKKLRVQLSTWVPAETGAQVDAWHAARVKTDPKAKLGNTIAEVVTAAKSAGYTGKKKGAAPSTATAPH